MCPRPLADGSSQARKCVSVCPGIPNHSRHLSLFTVCTSVVFSSHYWIPQHGVSCSCTHARTHRAFDSRQHLACPDTTTWADPWHGPQISFSSSCSLNEAGRPNEIIGVNMDCEWSSCRQTLCCLSLYLFSSTNSLNASCQGQMVLYYLPCKSLWWVFFFTLCEQKY